MVHGVSPGPLLITEQPELFWGFVAQHVRRQRGAAGAQPAAGGLFVQPAAHPLRVSLPRHHRVLHARRLLGEPQRGRRVDHAGIAALGYVLRKLDFELAPVVLGLVLSPMLELTVRQSLAMSAGNYGIFFDRPIAVPMLAIGVILVVLALRPLVSRTLDWRSRLPAES